jgi:hypothetical protein
MTQVITPNMLSKISGHVSIWGRSQVGKSSLAEAWAFAIAKEGRGAVTFADRHGSARNLAERLANPANGCQHVHFEYLKCGDTNHAFGLEPLYIPDRHLLTAEELRAAAHDAALLCASGIVSTYGSKMTETPQLETNLYAISFFGALKGLSLVELLPAISLSGHAIRDFLISDCSDCPASIVLSDLQTLADRSPSKFFEAINSLRNRLVRWTNDRRLIRILGHPKPLNATRIINDKINVFLDSNGMSEPDSDYINTLLQCAYFAGAHRRRPHTGPMHRLFVDEAQGSFCDASARMMDQVRKFRFEGTWIFHRFTQVAEKGDFIAGAIMTHTTKLIFQVKDEEDARRLATDAFTGHLNLAEWKPGTERPTPVGQQKIILKSRTRSEQFSETESITETVMRSSARAFAASRATGFSNGQSFGAGDSLSLAAMPPDRMLSPPTPISKTTGSNISAATSNARSVMNAASWSRQYAEARGRSRAHATSSGTAVADGEAEALATVYADLPTATYSLEEQLHRATAAVMTQTPRHFILKPDIGPPIMARMDDVPPAWKSLAFRAQWWPRYLATAAARSALLLPVAQVDAAIAARMQRISDIYQVRDDTNFADPESGGDIVNDPQRYAAEFHRRQNTQPKLRIVHARTGGDKDGQ